MNWRKLSILVAIPATLLLILYVLNPKDFWSSPWFLVWCAMGGLPLIFYPAIWAPDLYRQANKSVSRPNHLLWTGIGFSVGAIIWFLVTIILFTQFPGILGLSVAGNFMIVFLPSIFFLAIGLTLIGQRASMWYLD
jgi:hypothetical protein